MPKAQTQKNKVNNLFTHSPLLQLLLLANRLGKKIDIFPVFSRQKSFGLLSIFVSLPPVLHVISHNSFSIEIKPVPLTNSIKSLSLEIISPPSPIPSPVQRGKSIQSSVNKEIQIVGQPGCSWGRKLPLTSASHLRISAQLIIKNKSTPQAIEPATREQYL